MPSKKNKRPPRAGQKVPRRRGNLLAVASENTGLELPGHGPFNGFSMKDEARNTASHQPVWGRDVRLRHQPVAFVSAGFTEPLKHLPEQPPSLEAATEETEGIKTPETDRANSRGPDDAGTAVRNATCLEVDSIHETSQKTSQQSGKIHPTVAKHTLEAPAATDAVTASKDASSSTAVGFFFDLKGDKSLASRHPPGAAHSSEGDSDSSEDVILFRGRANMARARMQEKARGLGVASPATGPDPLQAHSDLGLPAMQPPPPRHVQEGISGRNGDLQPLQGSPLHMQTLSRREEEAALIADYIANMEKDSDDETQDHQTFNSMRDLGGDEGAFGLGSIPDSDAESRLSASDQELASERETEGEGEGDDEALAMLLAKQEELGLGSDELLLFSESYTKVGKPTKHRSQSSQKASKISEVLKGPFASATAVAEALDNLEIRDYQDEAPLGRGRRARQAPVFDVSDSELEARLQAAWITDRERKKSRRMEREELRARGLLGKNVGADDLQTKYPTGMTLEKIKEELKVFMLGTDEKLHFPPMDKQARKMLHELAGKFKIKSQSTGNGDQRRPVLSKTRRTVTYATYEAGLAVEHIEAASAPIRRKYFHRADARGSYGHGSKDAGFGRSGGKAVTYREGEVVGGTAPELGQENKGHAMLEKMGWSKGMALGAHENQGILEPVAQVVKRSKAGLG
ncbi:hypothetical protein GQ53DRAFT_746694 [Thozetella sp. PMI_491]|nr:hypothetical protein GQ53DRAFT_746694 [Thozetella sp. PMI_491]